MLESLFNKVTGLKACNFIKKKLQQRRFSVKFAEVLTTPILKKILERHGTFFLFICLDLCFCTNIVTVPKTSRNRKQDPGIFQKKFFRQIIIIYWTLKFSNRLF